MGSINLYKIDGEKKATFLQELAHKMESKETIFLVSQNEKGIVENFGLTLFGYPERKTKNRLELGIRRVSRAVNRSSNCTKRNCCRRKG